MQKYPLDVQYVFKKKKKQNTAKINTMSNKNNIQYVSTNQNVSPIDFNTRWQWYLYSYGTESHFIWLVGEFKLGSHLAWGDVESVEVDCGEVGGRGIADAKGRGIRLCIKQTKLSTLQVSFHQCNFCQQNNRKGKGKV